METIDGNKHCSSQEAIIKDDVRHDTGPLSNTSSSSRVLGPVSDITDSGIDTDATVVESNSGRRLNRKEVFVTGFILGTVLCETMAYFSVIANLVLFCTTKLQFSIYTAVTTAFVFSGTLNVIPIFGGFVADAWTGKFKAIAGAGFIYIFGLLLLCASAVNYKDTFEAEEDISIEGRKATFFFALVFVAIGTGGVKANIGPFGAQQIKHLGSRVVQSYFIWYYWFRNVGGVIAYTGVAYVQQEIGFHIGFLIPCVLMLCCVVGFISLKSLYTHQIASGGILGTAFGLCVATISGFKRHFLLHANREHGKNYADVMVYGVKAVIRLLPIFGLFVVYWAVYWQMSTSLFLQSERMAITVDDVRLPAAILSVFNALVVIFLIPLMDRVVYPVLERRGRKPSNLHRMGLGMILATLAMVYAGIIEIVRKDHIKHHGSIEQSLSSERYNASRLSMFVQIPEFALIGTSEVFTVISGLEFAYTQAPSSMQGLIMGIFLFTSGLGSYIASLIIVIVKAWRKSDASDWFPIEPNDGHLEYLLFLLATLTFVNFVLFIAVTRWYKRKRLQRMDSIEDPFSCSTVMSTGAP